MREHRSSRPAADDAHVRLDLELPHLGRARDLERVRAGVRDLARAVEGGVAGALVERLVADRRVAARVAVVADVGQLVGHADDRLHEPAQELGAGLRQHVAVEVRLEVVEPALLVELGERGLEREQRVQLHRHQPGALHPAPPRPDAAEVAVDVRGDVVRRDRLLGALHDHVGERHQRAVLGCAEEARPQPGPQRDAAENQQRGGDRRVGRDVAEQPRARARLHSEDRDLLVEPHQR
jgi:hypothetical protein